MGVQSADILGFEGLYRITTDGKVFSSGGKSNHLKEIEMKYSFDKDGYRKLTLKKTVDGVKRQSTRRVCRLVASAFIPNPNNLPMVNHIDADRSNDTVKNLEWVSGYGNWIHANPNGECAVLQLSLTGEIVAEHRSLMEAMRQTGIQQGNITNCIKGRCKSVGGYRWRKK